MKTLLFALAAGAAISGTAAAQPPADCKPSALNIPGAPPVSPALGVTAAAYTNNDADPNTATTLFDTPADIPFLAPARERRCRAA